MKSIKEQRLSRKNLNIDIENTKSFNDDKQSLDKTNELNESNSYKTADSIKTHNEQSLIQGKNDQVIQILS